MLPVSGDLPEVVAEGGDDCHGRHRTGIDQAKHLLGRVKGMLAQGDPGQAVVSARFHAGLNLPVGIDNRGTISFPVQDIQDTLGNLPRPVREPSLTAYIFDVKCVQIRIAERDGVGLMSSTLFLFRFLAWFAFVFFG